MLMMKMKGGVSFPSLSYTLLLKCIWCWDLVLNGVFGVVVMLVG